mgnify:FL=1
MIGLDPSNDLDNERPDSSVILLAQLLPGDRVGLAQLREPAGKDGFIHACSGFP